MKLSSLLFATTVVFCSDADNSDVLVLTTDTFADAIKDNSLIMVEFYAPCISIH